MVAHVLGVPVTLQPVLRSILLDKVIDSIPEVIRLEQQQLNDEVADLSFIAFVATHRLQPETNSMSTSPRIWREITTTCEQCKMPVCIPSTE